MARLTARLEGVDAGLEDALESVARASREVQQSIDSLDETVQDIQESMGGAAASADNAGDEISGAADDARTASQSFDTLDENTDDLVKASVVLQRAISELSGELFQGAVASKGMSEGQERLADESQQAMASLYGLNESLDEFNTDAILASLTSRSAGRGIDEMGDEARGATGELIGAASAAELLSLRSSALSINVGLFTVALRNLTTQVPLLVAALGNLTAAFAGLGSAIAGVGLGGASLALAGMAARAEELQGPLEGAGNHFQALGRMAENIKLIFIEALQPLLNTEGVVEVFRNTIEDLANIVQSFGESVRATFEGTFADVDGNEFQSLAETMKGVSDAVMENIDPITDAVGALVVTLGDDLVDITDSLLEGLPGFFHFVTVATEEMLAIFSTSGENIGSFITELMSLGRAVAAGVAPILASFFDIIGSVANAINSLGRENVATAAKIVTLVVALNRLSGILGAVAIPLASFTASIANFTSTAVSAGGPVRGFTEVLTTLSGIISSNEKGIGRLATAFSLILPPLGEEVNLMEELNDEIDKHGGLISLLRARYGGFISDSQYVSNAIGRVKGAVRAASSRIYGLGTAMLVAGQNAVSFGTSFDVMANHAAGVVDSLQASVAGLLQRVQDADTLGQLFPDNFSVGRLVPDLSAIGDRIDSGITGVLGPGSPVDDAINSVAATFSRTASVISSRASAISDRVSILGDRFSSFRSRVGQSLGRVRDGLSRVVGGLVSVSRKYVGAAAAVGDFVAAQRNLNLSQRRNNFIQLAQSIGRGLSDAILGSALSALSYLNVALINLSSRLVLAGNATQFLKFQFGSLGAISAFSTTLDAVTGSLGGLRNAITAVIPGTSSLYSANRSLATSLAQSGGAARLLGVGLAASSAALTKNRSVVKSLNSAIDLFTDVSKDASISQKVLGVTSTLTTGALQSLKGAIVSLQASLVAVATGASVLAAVLASIVVIVGTVGAVLATLGSSGESADSIIQGLKSTLAALGSAVMPIVVESSEMMLDIFNSIMTPLDALVEGLTEIGVALGLIEEGAGGGGMISMVETLSASITPVLEQVGYFARLMGGILTEQIEYATDAIVGFIQSNNIDEALSTIISSTSELAGPIMDLLVSGFELLKGAVEGSIGLLGAVLDIVLTPLSLLGELISGVVGELLGIEGLSAFQIIAGGISLAQDGLGALIGAISDVLTVLADIGSVAGGVLGYLLKAFADVQGFVGNVLVDTFIFLASVVRDVFNEVASVFDALFGGLLDRLANFVNGGIRAARQIGDALMSIPDVITSFWNNTIGGTKIEIPESTIEIPGGDNITIGGDTLLEIPTIQQGGGGTSGSGESNRPTIPEATVTSEQLARGGGTAAELGQRAKESVMGGVGRGPNVEVNEGDTTNVFNQNISADPESKAQIGRIAKDAMEEANSFKRRQEGSQ